MRPVTPEVAQRLALQEEAEQRAHMNREEASLLRDWLTRLVGQDSMEDQLEYGDGNGPREDEHG